MEYLANFEGFKIKAFGRVGLLAFGLFRGAIRLMTYRRNVHEPQPTIFKPELQSSDFFIATTSLLLRRLFITGTWLDESLLTPSTSGVASEGNWSNSKLIEYKSDQILS